MSSWAMMSAMSSWLDPRPKAGIKVDEMEPGRAGILPGFCGVEGGTVGLFGTRRSLVESHRLTVNYINSGEESKSHSFKV